MRMYNTFIITLTLVSCFITTLLAFFGQNDLQLYFVINTIAFMIITLLYVYFNPRVRKALNTIGAVFFTGFLVIVTLKVIEIIRG